MINETFAAELRKTYRERHGGFSDVILNHDLKKAADWAAHVAQLKAQLEPLRAQLNALAESDEAEVLGPLRTAADEALAEHIRASAALETARISCESRTAAISNQIIDLTARMRTPMFPTPTEWKALEVAPADKLEVTLAAATPMRAGGGWIDAKGIIPGMPATFN